VGITGAVENIRALRWGNRGQIILYFTSKELYQKSSLPSFVGNGQLEKFADRKKDL